MPALPLLVEAIGLKKNYQAGLSSVLVLKGIDLFLKRGEFLAIRGPSGSGKSTLLQLVGLLDATFEGSYCFNGVDVSSLDDQALSALRSSSIGFVFQSFFLIPQLTLSENIALPFFYQKPKLSPQRIKEKTLVAIEKVGLQDRLHHKPSELSGGEMQRAAIARAIICNPLLILADEPTGNLDSRNRDAILELFRELHQSGSSVVVVTHDKQVSQACTRVLFMQEGQLQESSSHEGGLSHG